MTNGRATALLVMGLANFHREAGLSAIKNMTDGRVTAPLVIFVIFYWVIRGYSGSPGSALSSRPTYPFPVPA